MLKTLIITTGLLCAVPLFAHAQLWQCPKPGGGSTYQETPCAGTRTLQPVQVAEPLLAKGTVACLTSTHYEQAMEAISQKDERAWQYLMEKKLCLVTNRALPVSLLYNHPRGGPSKVRLYTEDGKITTELWTDSDFIQEPQRVSR